MRIFFRHKEKLFCERYWNHVLKKNKNMKKIDRVSTGFDITDANNYLLGCCGRGYLSKFRKSVGMNIDKFIACSDLEFKFLKPTKEPLTLWRGIGTPDYGNNSFPQVLFEKSLKTQKGDIVYMPEYAYASASREYSEFYTKMDGGILYQIEVPKGAKISRANEYIFPRYSKFECIGTEEIENGKLIKLRYIKRG